MSKQTSIYNIQCMAGHVWSPEVGSDLEKRCAARTQLDALCVSHDECPECQEAARQAARRFHDMCCMVECPFNDRCVGRCRGTMTEQTLTFGGVAQKILVPIEGL